MKTTKRIKIKWLLILVAVSCTATAFTAKKHYEKRFDTVYYWFNAITDEFTGTNTLSVEANLRGCLGPMSNPTCENGYVQSHLLNPSMPGLGHAAIAPDAYINKTNF